MNLNPVFFLVIAILLSAPVKSQNQSDLESLKRLLLEVTSVNEKANILEELSSAYCFVNQDSAYAYAQILFELGMSSKDQSVLANGYHFLGTSLDNLGRLEEAAEHLIKAVHLYEENNDLINAEFSRLSLANVYLNQGDVFWDNYQDTLAMEQFGKAYDSYSDILKTAIAANDSNLIYKTYFNLGASSHRLENYEDVLHNLDEAYNWCSQAEKKEKKYDIDLAKISPLFELGQLNKAEEIIKEARAYFKANGLIESWLRSNLGLSLDYMYTDFNKSVELLLEADSLAETMNNNGLRVESVSRLYELYKDFGKYEQALEYLEKRAELSSALLTSKSVKIIEELNIEYDTERKEKELIIERSQKAEAKSYVLFLSVLLISILVLFTLGSLFFFQRQKNLKLKQEKKINNLLNEQEIKTLQSNLEGQDKERRRIAQDLHDRLGSRLSAVGMYLEASQDSDDAERLQNKAFKELQVAVKETREIAHDLETGVLSKFGLVPALQDLKAKLEETKSLNLILDWPDDSERRDNKSETAVYRIIQEIVNNTLKHSGATELRVTLKLTNSKCKLETRDNGIGFDTNKQAAGMGIKNIKSRIAALNGMLQIQSSKGAGTAYLMEFNFEKDEY